MQEKAGTEADTNTEDYGGFLSMLWTVACDPYGFIALVIISGFITLFMYEPIERLFEAVAHLFFT